MKKKLLTTLLFVIAALCLCVGISACNITAKFKLNFIVDDTVYATIDTSGGETISMPENPTKDEYIFDGWYWDKDIWQRPFTAGSLLEEKLTSDMSVYAKWIEEDVTKRSYTVTFNSMGGSNVDEVTVKHGNLIPEPQKPTKTGYVLAGWYKQADMSEEWNFKSDTVTEDIMLYAKWVAETAATGCDILTAEGFEINENTLTITVDNSQEHLALSALITVSPYATWNVSSDIAGNSVIPSATVSLEIGDNTYYINVTSGNGSNKKQYTVNIHRTAVYTVTYRPNNGESVLTESVGEGNKAQDKTVTKKGYSFKEWQYNGAAWDFKTEITGDITLEAVWDANDYEVTFDSNSGNDIQKKAVTYDAEFTFEVPKKTGYTFNGWKTKDGALLTKSTGEGLAVWTTAENITVYADWQVVEYTITYNNVENAVHTNIDKYTVEQEDITLTPATKEGYDFKGWFTEQECENQVQTIDVSQAENVTLWAKWEATKYTATWDGTVATGFDSGDGSFNNPYIISSGAEFAYFISTINSGVDGVEKSYFSLICNIDFNNIDLTIITSTFSGFFEGNGNTLSHVKLVSSTLAYYSLFESNSGTIQDLNITDLSISVKKTPGTIYVGSLVAYNTGVVNNCSVSGTINYSIICDSASSATYNYNIGIGGMIGYNSGTIENSDTNVTITIGTCVHNMSQIYVGGFVGINENEIDGCNVTASISAKQVTCMGKNLNTPHTCVYAGGFAGKNTSMLKNSDVAGSVYASHSTIGTLYNNCSEMHVGGFVSTNMGSIDHCHTSAIATATSPSRYQFLNYAGGFASDNNDGTINNCSASGLAKAYLGYDAFAGGFIAYAMYGSITNCYATGGAYAESATDSNNGNAGDAVAGGFIAYERELAGTTLISNCYALGTVKCAGSGAPHGTGVGNKHYVGGFIGIITSSSLSSTYNSVIENCRFTGSVSISGYGYASIWSGGFAGFIQGVTVSNCYSSGTVTATNASENSGASTYIGGFMARSVCTTNYCYSTSDCTADSVYNIYAGGFMGSSGSGAYANYCYVTGGVKATSSKGSARVGGLVGSNGGIITNCYATGDMTATVTSSSASAYSGGLVGSNSGTITNCYATGDVTATATATSSSTSAYAGGLVGYNSTITNCYRYNEQTVTAKNGSSSGTVSTDGTAESLTNLQSASFLTDTLQWDSSVWEFHSDTYPTLKF